MLKKVVIIALIILIVQLFSFVALAQIRGSFDFEITLEPELQTPSVEASKFGIDLGSLLDLDLTLSGLTFNNDLAIGIAGVEHYIATLETRLGILGLTNQFVFAAPFAIDAAGDIVRVGDVLFVKKRVTTQFSIAGLYIDTLFMYEDLNFPRPDDQVGSLTSLTDGIYDSTDQVFSFGTIITLDGVTEGKVNVTSKTAFNAEWDQLDYCGRGMLYVSYCPNYIKKASWDEAVRGETFEFSKEEIIISNIEVSGFTLKSDIMFEPVEPISHTLTVEANLFDWLDMSAELSSKDIISFGFDEVEYLVSSEPFTFTLTDKDGDLMIGTDDVIEIEADLPIQALTIDVYWEQIVGDEPEEVDFGVELNTDLGTLAMNFEYGDPEPNLDLYRVNFALSAKMNNFNFEMKADFRPSGLYEATVAIGTTFSL